MKMLEFLLELGKIFEWVPLSIVYKLKWLMEILIKEVKLKKQF